MQANICDQCGEIVVERQAGALVLSERMPTMGTVVRHYCRARCLVLYAAEHFDIAAGNLA